MLILLWSAFQNRSASLRPWTVWGGARPGLPSRCHLVDVCILLAVRNSPKQDKRPPGLHWIVSDFAGIVSVAPMVIGIATMLQRPPAWREAIESMAALAVLGAMSGVIVFLPLGLWETVVPAALVFPILLWLAARWQPVFSAAGTFIVSMSVALTAIYGLGHFSDSSLSISARVLQTQAVILVVAFGTTVLAALLAERRESEARLASANTMLEDEREHLAHSNRMLQRERDNKLMSLRAVMASISHEIKQPLSAITV